MPNFSHRAANLCLIYILGVTVSAHAQNFAASSPATDVSGRWIGVFDTVRPDGSVAPDSAFLRLQQQGNMLTGSAGQDEKTLSPIVSGQSEGQNVEFDVPVNPSTTVHFRLHSEGEHLRGEATGMHAGAGTKFLVDVTRWREGAPLPAVVHTPDALFRTISALDTRLFDAYNHCDLETLSGMVSLDLEFYHDKTGLATGRQPFLNSIRENICGKVQRTLVANSLEVYPLAHYGAVEIGVHRFTHPGHPEEGAGEAKFVTLWQNKDGAWFVTRVISYDHGSASK